MTAGSDRAFGCAAKPGNAVHCTARNEAVRDWLRVSGFGRHGSLALFLSRFRLLGLEPF
jgi:hypothetical protein